MRLEDRIGSLSPGKQADIILFDTNDLNLFPVNDPVQAVVFHANGSNVRTVMVSGEVLKRDGQILYPRLDEMKQRLAESARRILGEAGLAA